MMRVSPLFLILSAGAATFGIGQMLLPTAHAQPPKPVLTESCRVLVKSVHTVRTARGLETTGQIENTGQQMLTYTSVVAVYRDAAGLEIGRADGYLTAGPLRSGQSAGFRAFSPLMPAFSCVRLLLREAGQPVTTEMAASAKIEAQPPVRLRTTVW